MGTETDLDLSCRFLGFVTKIWVIEDTNFSIFIKKISTFF